MKRVSLAACEACAQCYRDRWIEDCPGCGARLVRSTVVGVASEEAAGRIILDALAQMRELDAAGTGG